jgi:hypothetical protein
MSVGSFNSVFIGRSSIVALWLYRASPGFTGFTSFSDFFKLLAVLPGRACTVPDDTLPLYRLL